MAAIARYIDAGLQVRSAVDGQTYVLKKVAFDGSAQNEAEASLREAQVLSSLRHPHIGERLGAAQAVAIAGQRITRTARAQPAQRPRRSEGRAQVVAAV